VPEYEFLSELLNYLEAEEISVDLFSQPDYWETWGDDEPYESKEDLTITSALEAWKSSEAVVVFFFLGLTPWSGSVYDALDADSRLETYGDFKPCFVSVCVGPQSIPDIQMGKTQAEFHFCLSVGGDGMPKDFDQYLAIVRKTEEITSMLHYLQELSGMEWELLISATY